nr:hypothetical protein [Tanacetum cinerariifolium]
MNPTVNTLSNEHFVFRSNYHGKRTDDVPFIPELVLVNENEEPEEEEFKEEEEPQEEEDMEVDIKEDENELGLIFPYEESNPLNPPLPAFDSVIEDVIESEDIVESKDVVVPTSV